MAVTINRYTSKLDTVYNADAAENTCNFKLTQYYINSTSEDVTVINRSNLPITVTRTANNFTTAKDFIIRNNYTFRSNSSILATIEAISHYRQHIKSTSEELNIIKEGLLRLFQENRFCHIASITIDRHISISDLKARRSLYIVDADLMLHIGLLDASHMHPYSVEGSLQFTEEVVERKASGVFVEIVDNDSSIAARYIYVAKQLVKVEPHRDEARVPGCYFTSIQNERPTQQFYTMTEAEQAIGLYKTKEDAETNGDPKLALEFNSAASKVLYEKLKAENIVLKNRLEEEHLKRTDHYEERSHYRKDQSEAIKIVPALVIGVIGALAYWNKK